jgi:hypothetical protein
LFILGGGVSKNPDKFIPFLTVSVPVVPAQLRNDAGTVGAAMFAAERAAETGPAAQPPDTIGATSAPGPTGTVGDIARDAEAGAKNVPAEPP